MSYPTISRIGDVSRTGRFSVNYDDTKTINFVSQSINVGENLPISSPHYGILITSSSVSASIFAVGNVRPGICDVNVRFSKSEDLLPFDDTRIRIDRADNFYSTGSKLENISGFTSPLWSKTQLRLNISSSTGQIIARSPSIRAAAGTEFAGRDLTGFCYYNFVSQSWDQYGSTDPITNTATNYDYAVHSGSFAVPPSGTNLYPSQFMPEVGYGTIQNSAGFLATLDTGAEIVETYEKLGYKNMGYPTILSMAPFSTKYHATSSNTFKMSNLIDRPFALEKAVIEIPVIARRVHDAGGYSQGKIFDNYVFFLYRQSHSARIIDSQGDVTSSQRFLIASSSAVFYNSASFGSLVSTDQVKIFNTPGFSYNFGMTYNPDSPTYETGSYTGSIILRMESAIANKKFPGFNWMFDQSNASTNRTAIQHYWPGGTGAEPFFDKSSGFSGKDGISTAYNATRASVVGINGIYDNSGSLLPIEKVDSRTLVSSLGGTDKPPGANTFLGTVLTDVSSSNGVVSPYILMPGDELIIGVDAAIPHIFSGSGGTQSPYEVLTGSFLQMNSGEASLTLFGSQIRDGVEFHDTLNQPLASDAIRESLHYDNPVIDQFDIEDRKLFSGSFYDEVVTGSITDTSTTTNRQIVGSRVNGLNEQWSGDGPGISVPFGLPPDKPGFIRAVQTNDPSERFFDSVPPNPVDVWGRDGKVAVDAGGTKEFLLLLGKSDSVPTHYNDVWQFSYPFEPRYGDLKRSILRNKPTITGSLGSNIGQKLATVAFLRDNNYVGYGGHDQDRYFNLDEINKFIYGVGTGPTGSVPMITTGSTIWGGQGKKASLGPIRGWKYGLAGVTNIQTKAYFRRDKYGQFRDLLEQRLDTKVFKGGSEVTDSPVQIIFLTADTAVNDFTDQSSNVSFEATSSVPYIDDQARNRNYAAASTVEVI